jgi:excisionase family DNA binding protein
VALKIRKFNSGGPTADEPQAGIGLNRLELIFGFGGAMSKANPHNLVRHARQEAKGETALNGRKNEAQERRSLFACLLIVPSDAQPIVTLLEQLAANSQTPIPFSSLLDQEPNSAARIEDCWLEHTEAAKYLGISKSTLYRYVCEQKVECRKIAGRLEYRQSILEKLMNEQTRPARLFHRSGGILPSAPCSGK